MRIFIVADNASSLFGGEAFIPFKRARNMLPISSISICEKKTASR
jgi:hypothetical protein